MTDNFKRVQNIVGSFMEKTLKVPAYEGFTKAACIAIFLAKDEAKRLHRGRVDDDTLLLGLLSDEHGIAAQTLNGSGVTLKKARTQVEHMRGKDGGIKLSDVPLSDQVEAILHNAREEARKMFANTADTEHILLALLDPTAAKYARQILVELGIDCDMLKCTLTGNFDDI